MISYLLVFFAIIASGSAYVILGQSVLLHFVLVLLCAIKIFFSSSVRLSRSSMLIFLLFSLTFLLLMQLRGESITFADNASVLARMFIALLMCVALEADGVRLVALRFLKTFEAICIIGLFSWVIFNVPLLRDMVSLNMKISGGIGGYQDAFQCDINYKSIFFIAFSRNCDFEKYGFVRNHCIFWEPGVLAFFTAFFYMIKVLYLKETRRDILYFITILSTFSMGGISIFMAFFVGNWFFRHIYGSLHRKNYFFSYLLVFFLVISFVLSLADGSNFLGLLGGLFGRDITRDSSAQLRFYDFYYGLKAAFDHPWLGAGRDFHLYDEYLVDNAGVSKSGYEGGMTNAVVSIFYRYGVFFWILYMCSLYRFSKNMSSAGALMVFLFLLMMLMHEPLDTCVVMLFFIFFMRQSQKA